MTTARLKAHGGDRPANLRSIADTLDHYAKELQETDGDRHAVTDFIANKLPGYAEQLRIIASETDEPIEPEDY